MEKPTLEQLRDEWAEDGPEGLFHVVEDKLTGRWRHGTEHRCIIERLSDQTFWLIDYRTDKDGDYNDFRDLECDPPIQVIPVQKVVTTTEWRKYESFEKESEK